MQISVCMITRDEEDHIERALDSVPDHFEVIVLDTGSQDRTVEIARSKDASVYQESWNNDFSLSRNSSIKKATGDYVLILDADETLSDDIEKQIYEYIQQYPDEAASAVIINHVDNESTRHRMGRFFPRTSDFHYRGMVHEQIYKGNDPAPLRTSGITIHHYGYEQETYKKKNKLDRYINLYQSHLAATPDDSYMHYQLGKLYYSNKEYSKAYEAFLYVINQQEYDKLYFPPMLVQFAYTLKELGLSKESYEFTSSFLDQYPSFPDLPFVLGVLSMDCGYLNTIEYYFKLALSIGETNHYSSVEGVGSYRAAHNLGVFYEVLGNTELAIEYYKKAWQYNYPPSIERLEFLSKIV
ncbi:glycosyltransferase [Paenibacillus sediminis]|uniref:Glycosyltransferase involved in cell wall biosynthesis n=1 Tax=Paenibacillus sediminis TaxID=664909 RepID=A0ABS4H2Q2_9BACL|nr:glycosyltransferase [Paenibacillus sediminis]MBP1936657.1 glycosyltransferase involved in cell wall biosynthesis [Paenibacillus sediminis]